MTLPILPWPGHGRRCLRAGGREEGPHTPGEEELVLDFIDAYDQLNNELLYIDSLLVAAVCTKEHNLDDRVVTRFSVACEEEGRAQPEPPEGDEQGVSETGRENE